MASDALRRMEKALETASRQLALAGTAVAALRKELSRAPGRGSAAGNGSASASPRGGRRGALLDAETMRTGIFKLLNGSRAPLTTAQIMQSLVDGAKLKFRDQHAKTNFSTRISIAMRRYEQQGLVKTVGRAGKGNPIKWAPVK